MMQTQVGIITISDRASKGLYDDLGGPALKKAAEGYGQNHASRADMPEDRAGAQSNNKSKQEEAASKGRWHLPRSVRLLD